jgi:hypothetical protein
MPRDRGAGRPLLGLRAAWVPGPGGAVVEEAEFSAWELLGQLGWQWTLGLADPEAHVSVGPVVAAGGASRTTTGGVSVDTVQPWLVDPAFRLHVAGRHVLLSIETGARLIGGGDPGGGELHVFASPMFRIGAGARL